MNINKKLFAAVFATAIVLSLFGITAALATKPIPPPITATISFSAASFDAKTTNIVNVYGSPSVNLFAPVQLPQGAKITKLAFYVKDLVPGNLANQVVLTLIKIMPPGNPTVWAGFAQVHSADTPNVYYNSVSVTNLEYGIVNNNNGAYVLELSVPPVTVSGQSLTFYMAQIEYQVQ